MVVSYKELRDLFHISDRRCIEKGLANKVTFIRENMALIKDPDLKEIIAKFREEGCLTTDEVCELYKVNENVVINMSRAKIIPCFQLTEAKGSKKLFFKSELEACGGELFVMHSKQTNMNFLHYLIRTLGKELVDTGLMLEHERQVFNLVYTSGYSRGQVAQKMKITGERVRQILNKVNMRLMLATRQFISMGRTINILKEEYDILSNKYAVLTQTISDEVKAKAEAALGDNRPMYHILKERIKESRLSVRAIRCLNSSDIMTLGDLIVWKETDLVKFRNLGAKTYKEIVAYVESNGLKFETNIKQYGLLTTQEKIAQEQPISQ